VTYQAVSTGVVAGPLTAPALKHNEDQSAAISRASYSIFLWTSSVVSIINITLYRLLVGDPA